MDATDAASQRMWALIERRIRLACAGEHHWLMRSAAAVHQQYSCDVIGSGLCIRLCNFYLNRIKTGVPEQRAFGDRNVGVGAWQTYHWDILYKLTLLQ